MTMWKKTLQVHQHGFFSFETFWIPVFISKSFFFLPPQGNDRKEISETSFHNFHQTSFFNFVFLRTCFANELKCLICKARVVGFLDDDLIDTLHLLEGFLNVKLKTAFVPKRLFLLGRCFNAAASFELSVNKGIVKT